MNEIIVALITGGVTLVGVLISDQQAQAVTGVVLGAYFNKSKAENTKGGIVYDAALGVSNPNTDL